MKYRKTKQADLVLAYESAGRIKLGPKVEHLFTVINELGWTEAPLFHHANGIPWTSAHFQSVHLTPS
jgi:hypothetical protein